MSEVKIILKRSPRDPENGVWIDGVKVPDVKDVSVFGSATETPQVVITFIPKRLVMGIENPDLAKVNDDHQN